MADKELIEEVTAKLHEMFPGYMWQYYLDAVDALDVVASIERVQAIHSKTKHWDDDKTYTFICAGCMSYYSCRTAAALDGAPEPEWEYRATTDNGAFVGESRTTPEHAVQALQEAVDEYPTVLDEQGVKVERRPRSLWLPVEGEDE